MSLSDDARKACAAEMLADFGGLAGVVAQKALAAVLPDGRTIAQALDDGEEWRRWGNAAGAALKAIQSGDLTEIAAARTLADALDNHMGDR